MCTIYMIFLWIFETLKNDRFSNGGTLRMESGLIQKPGSCKKKLITLPANPIQIIIVLYLEMQVIIVIRNC